jgi:hypothetical protein
LSIAVGGYIVATKSIGQVPERAVGLVKSISGANIEVLFIGTGITTVTDADHIAYIDVKKTGKGYEKKICNICHLLKDTKEFDINQTDAKGRKTTRPSCKQCRIPIDGEHILPEDRRIMDSKKPIEIFTCPICRKKSIVGVTANLVRDHDHITGKAREWICDSCNTGLGRFKDDIVLLQRAIEYLRKYSKM